MRWVRTRVGDIFVPYIILKNVTFHVTKISDVSLEKKRKKIEDCRSRRDKSNKKCHVELRSSKDVSSNALRQGLKIIFCS